MDDIHLALVVAAAAAGGMTSAFLGWLRSTEPFNPRKLGLSLISAVVASIATGLVYQASDEARLRDLLMAFMAGAGADVLSNRAVGAVKTHAETTEE